MAAGRPAARATFVAPMFPEPTARTSLPLQIRAIKTLGPDATVADAMVPELPVIGHRSTLEQAFKLLQEKSAPAVGVVDHAGKLVGLVSNETIAEMMMLQSALPRDVKIGPWSRPAGV